MEVDIDNLTRILESGCENRQFASLDCTASAIRTLALIDGTFAQNAARTALSEASAINHPILMDMVFRHTEVESGIVPGDLSTS